jgi:hypothetical protein
MTGEKNANSKHLLLLTQTGAQLDFLPLVRGRSSVFAPLFPIGGALAQHSYAQGYREGRRKILPLCLTSSFFAKSLIFKWFSVCSIRRQSWLFQWAVGFSRLFHAAIHRIIHSFWGKPEKTLPTEAVSEDLHSSVFGSASSRASAAFSWRC